MSESPEQPARLSTPAQAALVLLVEDDVIARRMMCKVLKRDGFLVAEAGNGQEALAAYDQRPPDIVLLDIEMPVMDGYTTCRELRTRANTQQLPVLMVSGNSDMASVNRAYDEGANDFITKPVSLDKLGLTLKKWLHTRKDSV
ncbi:MAG: response regulator [Gammaproteobacteria bacterium]